MSLAKYVKTKLMGNFGSHGNLVNFFRTKIYNKYPYMFIQSKFPSAIELELTNECNMLCPHCPRTTSMTRKVGFMDLDLVKGIILEMSQHKRTMLRIVGLGEPALHPDLKEILAYAKNHKLVTEFTTNGSIFHFLTLEEIIDSGISYLGISIDGYDERSYQKRRVGGNYKELRDKVEQLYKAKKLLNAERPIIAIRNVAFKNDSQEKLDAYRLDWFQHSDLVSFNYYKPNRAVNENSSLKRCKSIKFELKVNWNGDVPLCRFQDAFRHEDIIANAKNFSIEKIWENKKLQEARKMHSQRNLDDIAYCKTCPQVQRTVQGIIKMWKVK